MENRFTRLLLMLAVAAVLTGMPPAAYVALGQQKKQGTKTDPYPTLLQVYAKDGRESLIARCTPIDPDFSDPEAQRVSVQISE